MLAYWIRRNAARCPTLVLNKRKNSDNDRGIGAEHDAVQVDQVPLSISCPPPKCYYRGQPDKFATSILAPTTNLFSYCKPAIERLAPDQTKKLI